MMSAQVARSVDSVGQNLQYADWKAAISKLEESKIAYKSKAPIQYKIKSRVGPVIN